MEVMASCWRGQVSDTEHRKIGFLFDANSQSCQGLRHLNALQAYFNAMLFPLRQENACAVPFL